MMKRKILKTIQAENLVSISSPPKTLNTLYWREEECKSQVSCHDFDINGFGCFGQVTCHLCFLSVKQLAACSAASILKETIPEYWLLGT